MSEAALRSRRWWQIGLFLSLALNISLLSWGIGRNWHDHRPDPAAGVAAAKPLLHWADRLKLLEPPERAKFEQAIKPYHPDIHAARQKFNQARDHVRDVLVAEPYNAEAMRDAFAAMRQANLDLQTKAQNGASEALANLTPQSRRTLANDSAAGIAP